MNRARYRLPLLPLFLFSLILNGCEAGDIGSSSSSAQVDNSDDHSVIGDTNCSFLCETTAAGVNFTRTCDGAQVSSGSFTDGTTCSQAASQFGEDGDVVGETESSVQNPGVNQGIDEGTL